MRDYDTRLSDGVREVRSRWIARSREKGEVADPARLVRDIYDMRAGVIRVTAERVSEKAVRELPRLPEAKLRHLMSLAREQVVEDIDVEAQQVLSDWGRAFELGRSHERSQRLLRDIVNITEMRNVEVDLNGAVRFTGDAEFLIDLQQSSKIAEMAYKFNARHGRFVRMVRTGPAEYRFMKTGGGDFLREVMSGPEAKPEASDQFIPRRRVRRRRVRDAAARGRAPTRLW